MDVSFLYHSLKLVGAIKSYNVSEKTISVRPNLDFFLVIKPRKEGYLLSRVSSTGRSLGATHVDTLPELITHLKEI